jgi:hypothetical protein
MRLVASFFLLALLSAPAQTGNRSTVVASGTASISVTPDQAQIDVSAVTQAASAQDATSQNATIAANIIAQVTQALGTSGTVQTVNYSVNPTYNNQGNLTGYSVTNTIQVTLNDLTITGKIIDTAVQAGASRIDSLQFTLKDDSGPRAQALAAATNKAKTLANAMAAAAGLQATSFITIQEAGATVVSPTLGTAAPTTTPIQSGQLTVTGTVTISMQLSQ